MHWECETSAHSFIRWWVRWCLFHSSLVCVRERVVLVVYTGRQFFFVRSIEIHVCVCMCMRMRFKRRSFRLSACAQRAHAHTLTWFALVTNHILWNTHKQQLKTQMTQNNLKATDSNKLWNGIRQIQGEREKTFDAHCSKSWILFILLTNCIWWIQTFLELERRNKMTIDGSYCRICRKLVKNHSMWSKWSIIVKNCRMWSKMVKIDSKVDESGNKNRVWK